MTLKDAQTLLELLIAEQGADAPCAAYIYTKNDVVTYDGEDKLITYSDDVANQVLRRVNDSDAAYVYFSQMIEDYITETV